MKYWMYVYAVMKQVGEHQEVAYTDVFFTTLSPAAAYFSLNPGAKEGRINHLIISGFEITAEQYLKANAELNR